MASSRSLGVLAVDLVARIGGFEKGMSQAERVSKQKMDRIAKEAKRLGVVMGAAFLAAGTAVAAGVKSALDNADAIQQMSDRTGVAVETLSRLSVAAKLSDTSLESLQKGFVRIAQAQLEAREGSEAQIATFDRLGVSIEDLQRLSAEDLFKRTADGFRAMTDPADKAALAVRLLGRSGVELLPLMNEGSEGIERFDRLADQLGITLDENTTKAAAAFDDKMDLVDLAVRGVSNELLERLIPRMDSLAGRFTDAATEGKGVALVARDIADAFESVADKVYRAHEGIKTMLLGTQGLFDYAAASAAALFPGEAAGRDARELAIRARTALEMAEESRQNARNGLEPGINRPGGKIEFIDPPTPKRTGSTDRPDVDTGNGGAGAGLPEPETMHEYILALREMADQEAAQMERWKGLAATLEGPLAAAEFDHAQRLKEIKTAGTEAGASSTDIARALALETEAYEKNVEAIKAQLEPLDQLLADLDFEYDLLGKTNSARAVEIELRRLGLSLSTDEGKAAAARIESRILELETLEEQIHAMDDFRSSFQDNVAEVLDGSQSIGDAIKDMANDVIAQLARITAQNFSDSLFGGMGTDGTGAAGGWLAKLFGGFIQARAMGGPISPGVPYLVGEQGPELIVPKVVGTVMTAGQTAAMGRGGNSTNITFVLPGRNDLRTEAQRQVDLARATQRQTARGTA